MALPSTVVFAAGDIAYIAELNQLITDLNLSYTQYLTTLAPAYFVGSSTTSLLIAVASKVFTLTEASARAWTVGMTLHAASNAGPANYMEGQVTAYAHPTLTVNVTTIGGAGTLADWKIGLASPGSAITGMTVGTLTANQFVIANAAGNAIIGGTFARNATEDPAFWMGVV